MITTRWRLRLPVDRDFARISALPALLTVACRRTGSQRHVAFVCSFILWPSMVDLRAADVGQPPPPLPLAIKKLTEYNRIGLISTFWSSQNHTIAYMYYHTRFLCSESHKMPLRPGLCVSQTRFGMGGREKGGRWKEKEKGGKRKGRSGESSKGSKGERMGNWSFKLPKCNHCFRFDTENNEEVGLHVYPIRFRPNLWTVVSVHR